MPSGHVYASSGDIGVCAFMHMRPKADPLMASELRGGESRLAKENGNHHGTVQSAHAHTHTHAWECLWWRMQ